MAMRNPLYLDLELIRNTADYYGIAYSVETDVTERGTSGTGYGARAGAGPVSGNFDRTKGTEKQESYKQGATPFRVVNDVLDSLDQELIELGDDAVDLGKGNLIIVEGDLVLTGTSEVGAILGAMIPMMAASGGEMDDAMKAELFSSMVGGKEQPGRQLYKLSQPIGNGKVLVPIEKSYFFRSNSYDDLDRDVTIVGVIDRVIPEGSSRSLETWLLPDIGRTMRRAMKGKNALDGMLEVASSKLGMDVEDAKSVEGPALEIRPLVIY